MPGAAVGEEALCWRVAGGACFVLRGEGAVLVVGVLRSDEKMASRGVGEVVGEHRVHLPSDIAAFSAPPSEEWGEEEGAITILAYVALQSGDIYQVTTESVTALITSVSRPQSEHEKSHSTAHPAMFISMDDLFATPHEGTPKSELASTLLLSPPLSFDICTFSALGRGLLLVSGEKCHSSFVLMPRIPGEQDVAASRWSLRVEQPITAALVLDSNNLCYSTFRAALLAHVVGVEDDVPLLVMGASDGHLFWMPLSTASLVSSDDLPVYPLHHFSCSAVSSISLVSVVCCDKNSMKGLSSTSRRDHSRICIIHDNSSVAFLEADCKEESGLCRLLSPVMAVSFPELCRHQVLTIWEGIVFALTSGGKLVAYILQQHPAALPFIDVSKVPPIVFSSSNMKRILSFSIISSVIDNILPSIVICLADNTIFSFPLLHQVGEGHVADDVSGLEIDMVLTSNQQHIQTAQSRLKNMRNIFDIFVSFGPLRNWHNSKSFDEALSNEAMSCNSVRSILSNITTINSAKKIVLARKTMLDNELLSSAAFVQLLQANQWRTIFSVDFEIMTGKFPSSIMRTSEYYGKLTISTASAVAVQAVEGKALRSLWTCALSSTGKENVSHSHSSIINFKSLVKSSISGSHTYECQIFIPIVISITAPYELVLDIVVNSMFPCLMFSPLTSPLYADIEEHNAGGISLVDTTLKISAKTSSDEDILFKKQRNLSSFDIPLARLKKSLADILIVTKSFIRANSRSSCGENSLSSVLSKSGPSSVRYFSNKKKLNEMLGLGELSSPKPVPQYSMTSYIPVFSPKDDGLSELLLNRMTNTAQDIQKSCAAMSGNCRSNACNTYSFKMTNVQVKNTRDQSNLFDSVDPVVALKAIHHKSNSKLVLALLQADLHCDMAKTLSNCFSEEDGTGPTQIVDSHHFSESDVFSLPFELQQVMMECQTIQRKLANIGAEYAVNSQRVGGSECAQHYNHLTNGDKKNVEYVRETCDKLWGMYTLLREYGV